MGEREAVEAFRSGFNCAQAVLFQFADLVGLPKETLSLVATGFGAGMGRRQEVCGAVSGGIMAIGLARGRRLDQAKEGQEPAYALTRELMAAFEAEHGSVRCRDILDGCELLTPEGQAQFRERKLGERCEACIATAVRALDRLIR